MRVEHAPTAMLDHEKPFSMGAILGDMSAGECGEEVCLGIRVERMVKCRVAVVWG